MLRRAGWDEGEEMNAIIKFFKDMKEIHANDPVKHCNVYKQVGCAHVDGFLCDMRTCDITVDLRVTPNGIEVKK